MPSCLGPASPASRPVTGESRTQIGVQKSFLAALSDTSSCNSITSIAKISRRPSQQQQLPDGVGWMWPVCHMKRALHAWQAESVVTTFRAPLEQQLSEDVLCTAAQLMSSYFECEAVYESFMKAMNSAWLTIPSLSLASEGSRLKAFE